jgi:peptidoglycan hydrolase-like protein with peptidoglycan-binding domain
MTPPASTAQPASPPPGVPTEDNYTVLDRRRIQAALKQLGYYHGRVDAVFGPDTRAAIVHFQEDLGADPTGTLTPAEGLKLLSLLGQ